MAVEDLKATRVSPVTAPQDTVPPRDHNSWTWARTPNISTFCWMCRLVFTWWEWEDGVIVHKVRSFMFVLNYCSWCNCSQSQKFYVCTKLLFMHKINSFSNSKIHTFILHVVSWSSKWRALSVLLTCKLYWSYNPLWIKKFLIDWIIILKCAIFATIGAVASWLTGECFR